MQTSNVRSSNVISEIEQSYCLSIRYESDYGEHIDNLYIQQQNIHGVIKTLPAAIANDLNVSKDINAKTYDYIKGKLYNNDDEIQTITIELEDFIRHPGHDINIEPRLGRFYPRTLFTSEKLTMMDQMMPLRITDLLYDKIHINTSHPLCNYNTEVTLDIVDSNQFETTITKRQLNTNQLPDFMTGPGMQLRYNKQATDFLNDDDLLRSDNAIDSQFYTQARLVNHIDEIAQNQLKSIYKELIPAHSEILDLMSSINSHLDETLEIKKIIGLGMNQEELETNHLLDERIIHDINQNKTLPFDDASFDVVICSLSIEYITQPSKLFDEVSRILRPHGKFIISFSNRWFQSKAINVWKYLHEFERVGLVMEHFIESAHFGDINTYSLRGLPRPFNDYHNTLLSDPLYVVWASKM